MALLIDEPAGILSVALVSMILQEPNAAIDVPLGH
jgi:hypothetical protein